MLNVNQVRKHVLKTGSLTAAVGTGTVYSGVMGRYAKKRELNIIITSSGSNNVIIRQVPLFDQEDIDIFKSDVEKNKYIHIGCVTISIEPLMHQRYINTYGSAISGHCALVDSTFNKLDESVISIHKYDLSKGRSDYVSYPNHCLSLTDTHLQKRLSILLGIKGVNVEPGVELFSVCVGYIVSTVNSIHSGVMKGIHNVAIQGSEDATPDLLEGNNTEHLTNNYNNTEIISLPSDDDIYFKSKGGLLGSMIGGGRVIKRRTMRTDHNTGPSNSLTRCKSENFDRNKILRVIKNQQIREKLKSKEAPS
ncbi:putative P3 protein [Trifolium pratense virus B]|uniref:Putative P3 protein n=1 Tax=Trifolium pratense virus B TaxID=2448907 RepID=A0A510C2B6_9RHAB|nr:putative P3 protein [Trifolium pratense virus B]AYH53270.1 putative P3 protein [Trifolium pratense virus B]